MVETFRVKNVDTTLGARTEQTRKSELLNILVITLEIKVIEISKLVKIFIKVR